MRYAVDPFHFCNEPSKEKATVTTRKHTRTHDNNNNKNSINRTHRAGLAQKSSRTAVLTHTANTVAFSNPSYANGVYSPAASLCLFQSSS